MTLTQQLFKANTRLIKRIEEQLDSLDIDPEQTSLQKLYLFIDDYKINLTILKSKNSYNYLLTLDLGSNKILIKARFVFNEHTGKINIKEIIDNAHKIWRNSNETN